MTEIRRIGLTSAFKVTGLTSAITWAIFGIFWILMRTSFDGFSSEFVGVYLVGVIVCPILTGFGAVISAAIYNLVANQFGGFEVELKKIKTRR